MQVSLAKPQLPPTQRVKNILSRSFNQERQDRNPYQPEASHILKYAPKYYRSLAIEIRPYSPLLSKVKKIKKLKKLEGRTGDSFKKILPQNHWFNLLMNSRKEMEESPQITPNNTAVNLRKSLQRRLNLQKIKLFPNFTRVWLSSWKMDHSDSVFARYIWNLRSLKSLEIPFWGEYSAQAKQIFEKLERMGRRLLGSLEYFFANIELRDVDFRELFQKNKKVFSHLTALGLTGPFDPMFVEIPKVCKNLKCLSLELQGIDEKPEFLDLLASIQRLDKLKLIDFFWPKSSKRLWGWGHFKPQPSLRKLALIFEASQLVNEGLEPKNVVEHWGELQELDYLELNVECYKPEETVFVKQFITMVLKKVRKLCLLKYNMMGRIGDAEPFFVEEVPHLYESLEKFECHFSNQNHKSKQLAKFDLKMMKPFRNLKELKLEGHNITYENVEEAVSLLEGNQKEGDKSSVLQIKISSMFDQNWLGETLKKIKKMKKVEKKNLEIQIELGFYTEHHIKVLEKLCREIPAGIIRKGLTISLSISNLQNTKPFFAKRVREILDKYSEIRNLKLFLENGNTRVRFRKLDREQEQFSVS